MKHAALAGLAALAILSWQTAALRSRAGSKDSKPIVIEGILDGKDPKDKKLKGSPAKIHMLKLSKGVTYVIDLVSKDFDAFLRLEDAGGKELAEDDDGGGMLNARLFFIPPESAEYALIATTYKPKTGKYRLTVQPSNLLARPLKVDGGAVTVKDRLTQTGARSPFSPHSNCQLYRVDLKAGNTYVIDLESAAFDSYLSLADASLRHLASDDDGGGKLNARLRFECKEDGAYHIVATGLGNPDGEFTLKIAAAK
jgi:hypothetical protein